MRRKILFGIIACIGVFFIAVLLFANQDSYIPKEKIINIFSENKEKFFSAQEFAVTLEKYLYVNEYELDKDQSKYNNDITDLITKCNITSISEDRAVGFIYFTIESGTYEQGILYIKDNVLPEVSPSIGACERIIDHWFYYLITHT